MSAKKNDTTYLDTYHEIKAWCVQYASWLIDIADLCLDDLASAIFNNRKRLKDILNAESTEEKTEKKG